MISDARLRRLNDDPIASDGRFVLYWMQASQRTRWNRIKKNLGGRPKHGKYGTQIISVTVEKELLKQANAYAKAKGLKRSELVTQGLRLAMQQSAA